jgi:hypothetical protein
MMILKKLPYFFWGGAIGYSYFHFNLVFTISIVLIPLIFYTFYIYLEYGDIYILKSKNARRIDFLNDILKDIEEEEIKKLNETKNE